MRCAGRLEQCMPAASPNGCVFSTRRLVLVGAGRILLVPSAHHARCPGCSSFFYSTYRMPRLLTPVLTRLHGPHRQTTAPHPSAAALTVAVDGGSTCARHLVGQCTTCLEGCLQQLLLGGAAPVVDVSATRPAHHVLAEWALQAVPPWLDPCLQAGQPRPRRSVGTSLQTGQHISHEAGAQASHTDDA